MSGEYYYNEEAVNKYHKDYDLSPKSTVLNEPFEPRGQGQDHRLHEIEEQLEMAEDRCNTLKGQLDYMKQLYGVSRRSPKVRKISNIHVEKKSPEGKMSECSTMDESMDRSNRSYLKRQNSNAIGTDNTGAAVRTINNILNGITDSVNRLSELHVQISDTPRKGRTQAQSTGVSPHPVTAMKITSRSNNDLLASQNAGTYTEDPGPLQPLQESMGDNVSFIMNRKLKTIKKKPCKDLKVVNRKPVSSQQSIRRGTKLEKRVRTYTTTTIDRSVSAIMKRRILNGLRPQTSHHPHKLVEIYHNTAAKNSDSDEGNLQKAKSRRLTSSTTRKFTDGQSSKSFLTDVPPIDIPEKVEAACQDGEGEGDAPAPMLEVLCSNEPSNIDPLLAPRTDISTYSKNYELPTIASRMKQVAKSYLNSFTFKAIPFCAAISTSPSHNIGINIQQVMNIIKNRQPIRGISPTLAHNIGLAAERLNSKPLSALVSSVNSRTGYRMSQCPLSKTFFNYNQLQEMARGIPEETAEEVEDEVVESPEMKTIIITGPSGDMAVKNRNAPVWGSEDNKSEQCTCVPQSGVELQQVVNKYKKPVGPQTTKSVAVSSLDHSKCLSMTDNRLKSNTLSRRKLIAKKSQEVNKNGYTGPTVNTATSTAKVEEPELPDSNPLQGREKNLKEVLTNLHDEFEALNKKYEDLSVKASAEDDETLKELEKMEAELNKKEEEITMVMTLYKEVIALKQQVKSLKEKTSQGSLNTNASDIKFKEYNNPMAAFHLTKLLRQIQHYQMRFKRDFSTV